ncbi:sugar ABC transporter substrate-binding protein [Aestuariivirga litoralis]|uniref:sugar ABC transporter substrate-binding protein n=1 Tax=Aestuariivirga litoralis TaxID=2650924 RepID=UPI0018C5CEC1|nr:sugar ABC transporter substrate-binding protein [Aestuariivirga litoralis]MBG1231494.1 sugar ABC transporter substrate-binding protein [Aestuariivirga litoralis]
MNEGTRSLFLAIAMAALAGAQPAHAEAGSQGLTVPVVLPAFDPAAAPCHAPPDLKKELVFAQDNERDFMKGTKFGLEQAAKDHGLVFRVVLADNDAALMAEQMQALAADKTGAIVVAPINAAMLKPKLQQVLWQGSYVGAVVPPPATTILNAPQYLTGRVLGDAAAAYIKTHLGGKADVVLLTHDSLQFLAPRFRAIREALEALPEVNIIADISPPTVDRAGGYKTMGTILLANPNVDVVLGADTVVLGALAAIRDAKKDRPDQFFGGIDGEAEAVAEIQKGGPYKITVSLASPVFGYALGAQGADWLEGKSVPQAMDILPHALTTENLASYQADLADPGAVYADPARRAQYLKLYGNICYDTREQYLDFPWSSEAR